MVKVSFNIFYEILTADYISMHVYILYAIQYSEVFTTYQQVEIRLPYAPFKSNASCARIRCFDSESAERPLALCSIPFRLR